MGKSSFSMEESDSDSDYLSGESAGRRILSDNQIRSLKQTIDKVGSFIEELEEQADRPISDKMFRFCGKFKDFQMKSKNIFALLERRLQRMMKNKKRKKNWSDQDTKILVWIVSKYMDHVGIEQIQKLGQQNWKAISLLIPGAFPQSCMFKVLSLKQSKLSENKWTQQESAILSQLVSKDKKKNWKKLAQDLYLSLQSQSKIFRNAKQCKQHWTCFLNPDLKKGSWDISEDQTLFQYVLSNQGQKRWANLSKIIKGRTENALKNRFNIIIDRERIKTGIKDERKLILSYLDSLKLHEDYGVEKTGLEQKIQLDEKVKTNKEDKVQPKQSSQQEHINHPVQYQEGSIFMMIPVYFI